MNKFKKLFLCSLVLCHNMTMASDDRIGNAIVAGLLTTGGIICGGIAWKVSSDYSKQAQIDLDEQTKKVLTSAKNLIAEKSKYAQLLRVEDFLSNQTEAMLESIFFMFNQKQPFTCLQKNPLPMLKTDIQTLKEMKLNLSKPCFAQNVEIQQALRDVSTHLENALKLLSIIEKHNKFFETYSRLNFYALLPTRESEITDWVYSKSNNTLHPLLHYADKSEDYLELTENADLTSYPKIAKKVLESRSAIKKSLLYLYKTEKLQNEAYNKRQNEIQEAQLKAAQEKNKIEQTGADAQRRRAYAQEELVQSQRHANDLERKKIEEIQKSNTLLALRYPVEQENNRLQAEKNRLQAEKNRVAAEQNRLQSERARIDALHAENKRREIIAIEVQNHLLEERNRLERIRQATPQPAHHNPEPSAPPAPPTRDDARNIPVAMPYTGNQPPQATAQYRN